MHREAKAHVLEHGPVRARQDISQIAILLGSDFRHIWIQAGLPAAITQPPGEFGQVQRVVFQMALIEPFEPAASSYLRQVGGERVIVQLGSGDQENFGVHVPHDLGPYRCAPTLAAVPLRVRHSLSTLATTTRPASPDAVRIDSGWNCTAHRPTAGSSIAITTSPPPAGSAVTAVTANPPMTWSAVAYSE